MDRDAFGMALVVGFGLLAVLFAGQVWSFAARWIGRSIAGAVQILLVIGATYAVYQVYSGWSAADSAADNEYESSLDLEEEFDTTDASLNSELPEQELEQEIDEDLESPSK